MTKLKKLGFITVMALAFLLVASVVAFVSGFLPGQEQEYYILYLIAGVAVIVLSGIVALIVKKNAAVNAVCFFVNGVALGICIRAWYLYRRIDNDIFTLILVCIACIAYIWLFVALCQIPVLARHIRAFFWVWLILSALGYFAAVTFTKTTFVSTFGIYMLVLCSFAYAVVRPAENKRELLRTLTVSTYTVFVLIVIIAVLSAASADGFNLNFPSGSGNNKDGGQGGSAGEG